MKRLSFLLLGSIISFNIFAADPNIREITTPPPPEGPLTSDQIPAIDATGKPITEKTATPTQQVIPLTAAPTAPASSPPPPPPGTLKSLPTAPKTPPKPPLNH